MVLQAICQHEELSNVVSFTMPRLHAVLNVVAECCYRLMHSETLRYVFVTSARRFTMAKRPCTSSSGAYSDIPSTKLHHLRAEVPSDLQSGESRVIYMKRLADCGFYRYFRIYCEKLGYSMRRMSTCKFKLINDGGSTDVITQHAKRGAKQ